MSSFRAGLPQLTGERFLTDSGLETTLIFADGYVLPDFAAFVLLDDAPGRARLTRYFGEHARVAAEHGAGFILEAPTWRANRDWGARLGYDESALAAVNRHAVALLEAVRGEIEADQPTSTSTSASMVVSGCVGPRGDGYDGRALMTAPEAESYHAVQIRTFADTTADMVNAMTLTYPAEAIGVVLAARAAGIPAAVSFTVETDGRLPDGTSLGDAIHQVDRATDGAAAYFAVNCAHPTHLERVLDPDADWMPRLRGLRANASRQSHAELDRAEQLDAGDPDELAEEYRELCRRLPQLNVLGGCCGTDLRHVRRIAALS
jgi:S-methylmethionine-dependent homocysteine/selenocysteine methylase